MYLFDTNIFLEYLLEQEQADACGKALAKVGPQTQGWLTSFSLHAIEALHRPKQYNRLENFLDFLIESPFFHIYQSSPSEERDVVKLSKRLSLDFDDALQVWVARHKKLILVTLDKDFTKIKDPKILSPHDL